MIELFQDLHLRFDLVVGLRVDISLHVEHLHCILLVLFSVSAQVHLRESPSPQLAQDLILIDFLETVFFLDTLDRSRCQIV